MNFKDIFRILGQIISVSLVLFFGSFLIEFNIPGNGGLCDPEQIFFAGFWMIFLLISIGLIINSLVYYQKNKWKNYRIAVIILTIILLFFSVFTREIVMTTYYGKPINIIKGTEPVIVKIQLYKNGKFFAYTYDAACEIENTGTYSLSDNILTLNFKEEKSKYLGTTYKIENNHVHCTDCEENYELTIKNHPNE